MQDGWKPPSPPGCCIEFLPFSGPSSVFLATVQRMYTPLRPPNGELFFNVKDVSPFSERYDEVRCLFPFLAFIPEDPPLPFSALHNQGGNFVVPFSGTAGWPPADSDQCQDFFFMTAGCHPFAIVARGHRVYAFARAGNSARSLR